MNLTYGLLLLLTFSYLYNSLVSAPLVFFTQQTLCLPCTFLTSPHGT